MDAEAENLILRSQLMLKVREMTQSEAARLYTVLKLFEVRKV